MRASTSIGLASCSRAVIWDARLDLLPLSTTANASTLRAALAAMGLTLTRASAATVQTSASEVVTSGIGVDDPRVGDGGYGRGLVLEETRTNYNPKARSFLVVDGWTNGGAVITGDAMAGPDGSVSADRQQAASGAFGVYRTVLSATSYTTASMWRRSGTGAVASHAWFIVGGANAASNQNNALGATWERSALTIASPGGGVGPISTCDGRTLGAPYNLTAGARDAALDLLQVEVGKFATEAILTTGAAATRAADRLAMADASRIIRNGRLSMARRFVPKGSIGGSNDYAAAVRLWTVDASNYAELHQTTGVCTVVVAGASYSTASGFTWAANDVVDVWCEAGGGSLQTVVKARKNSGAVTTLGTGAAQGTIPNNAGIDLASNGTSAVLTASHQQIQAYAPGRRIAWAS